MVCPKCKCEARIISQRMIFNQEEGKLYRALSYVCRNKNCDKYDKEIGEEKNEIPVSTE